MDEPTAIGIGFTRAYCDSCKKIQPTRERLSDDALDIVCKVCQWVVATLDAEGFVALPAKRAAGSYVRQSAPTA
jgi:hypothetical protein